MKYNTFERDKNITLFLYLTVPVILTGLLIVYPMIRLVLYSFSDWNGLSLYSNIVGADNYRKIFTKMPEVWLSLKNNAVYFLGHLFFIPVEMLIAYYLDRQRRFGEFYKTMVLLTLYCKRCGRILYVQFFLLSQQRHDGCYSGSSGNRRTVPVAEQSRPGQSYADCRL